MKLLITFTTICIGTILGYLIERSTIDSDFKLIFILLILVTCIGIIGGMYNLAGIDENK